MLEHKKRLMFNVFVFFVRFVVCFLVSIFFMFSKDMCYILPCFLIDIDFDGFYADLHHFSAHVFSKVHIFGIPQILRFKQVICLKMCQGFSVFWVSWFKNPEIIEMRAFRFSHKQIEKL